MKREATAGTAAESQRLSAGICTQDGIGLVNVVRKPEQAVAAGRAPCTAATAVWLTDARG